MKAKRFIFMLLVMLMSVTGAWALDNVPYVDMEVSTDAEGHVKVTPVAKIANNVTEITNESEELAAGWYVVTGADVHTGTLTCNGAVHIILADGAKLTATGDDYEQAGIRVTGEDNSLIIYGQTNQTGQLIATGGYFSAGIGGNKWESGSNITINGGVITANGRDNSAAIGGGAWGDGSNITFNGGVTTANGGSSYSVIGGGSNAYANNISFNGGKVYAAASMPGYYVIDIPYHTDPNIHVAESLILMVGEDNPPTQEVDCSEDEWYYSFKKRYATIRPKSEPEPEPTYIKVVYMDAYGWHHEAQNVLKITSSTEQITLTEGWYAVLGGDVVLSAGAVCEGNVNLIVANEAKLTVTGGQGQAGIQVSGADNSLTIYGQYDNLWGELIAIGGEHGAGIGGGENEEGSNIHIYGGKITANGGTGADGIGSGYQGAASSNIFVAERMMVKAGNTATPTTLISHTTDQDVANSLSGKTYATANQVAPVLVYTNSAANMDAYYSTYFNGTTAYRAESFATLYTASLATYDDETYLELHEITDKILPANTPVIVKCRFDIALLYYYGGSTEDVVIPENDLTGTNDGTVVAANTVYTMEVEEVDGVNTLGFYLFEGTDIPAHTAYLQLPTGTPAPHRIGFGSHVTLDMQGGSEGTENVTAINNVAMPEITIPTRTGYMFNGYYTEQNGQGTQYYNADGTSAHICDFTGDKNLYAYWTANQYTITLDMQGGSEGTESVTPTYNAAMPDITTLPTRTGYTFQGYYTEQNGQGTQYYNADGTSAHICDFTENKTLYAYWMANQYTITLDMQGGSEGTESVTATYDAAMPEITIPRLTGYTFQGYYTEQNGQGTQYYNTDGTSARISDLTEDKTLYAFWDKSVPYVDADGNPCLANPVTEITDASESVTWTDGWYVVTGDVTLSKGAICRSNVNLILADDAKLTLTGAENEAGIRVSDPGATLTIYGQANQSGQLIATGGDGAAGIGGSLNRVGRNIRINGGIVKANGGTGAPAVGGYGIVDEFSGELHASNIFVNSLLTVHADDNNPPTMEIEHTSTDDLASVLSDKRYLTAQHFHHFAESREEGEAYYTCACGYIDPVRQHVHNYEWVVADEHQHKQVCTSEVGTCIAPIVDEGEHNYDNSAVEGTVAYYSCGTCGYIDPVRQHVHNYEWVVVDEHQHKQVCTSEVGTCIVRERNEGDHNIHESILCDTENYQCDVCQYVDEAKKAQFGERDYMSMTAVGGDVAVGFKKVGSPADYTIQISADGNHWSEPQTLTETTELATIPTSETYYFRHGTAEAIGRISSNGNYWTFTMTGTGTIEADGNIMSLLDATVQKNNLGMIYTFANLFKGCDKLTKAPKLPATSICERCYMGMFEETGIIEAPELPADKVFKGAYLNMFRNCLNLETAPNLVATQIWWIGYQDMFSGCKKITEVTLGDITYIENPNVFTRWLDGTAEGTNGKIIVPLAMLKDTRISTPSNWQWATKLKANEDPTPGEEGNFYTTFYDSRYDYTIAEGHKAYSGIVASGDDDDELRLTPTPGNIVPKGNGVLLHGGSDEVLLTVSDEGASTIPGNVLTGSDENTPALANCYILSYGQNGLGFYRYAEGKSLSAHKAYLTYQHGAGAQARALRMVFADDNEVDGIQRIENGESETENSVIYNLNGMRMNKLQKGINIVNGKKVIVK